MSSYKILTDSCCDFTRQQYDELNVGSACLTVLYNGENHSNFSDPIAVKAFYDELRAGVTASTSAVNPGGWTDLMKPVLEAGQDVLVLAFSSGLSTTYQSAVIAARELAEAYPQRTIRVVDTFAASLGQGLLVWYACQKRDEGLSLEELTAWVEDAKNHIGHWFTVDDLNHLKRGGRVSATTALVGTMLNIKPILYMSEDGKLTSASKVRGRKAAIEHLAQKAAELGEGYDNETMFIAHGDCPGDAAALEALLKEKCGVKTVVTGYVGPVIGAHTGPGVLALFFLSQHKHA